MRITLDKFLELSEFNEEKYLIEVNSQEELEIARSRAKDVGFPLMLRCSYLRMDEDLTKESWSTLRKTWKRKDYIL